MYGLPKGAKARVKIAGPGKFKRTLTKTTTIKSAKPGTYRVTATPVTFKGKRYKPTVKPRVKVAVRKNKTTRVRVRHLSASSSLSPGSPPASPPPASPPPASPPVALRFELADAVGAAVPEQLGRARAAGVSAASASGPALLAVAPDGQMKSAIASGELPDGVYVAATFPGPRKKLAVAYGGHPTSGTVTEFCQLGLIDRKTGEQTCLEVYRSGAQAWFWVDAGTLGVQFDAQGRVYYRGTEIANNGSQNKYVIRRHDGTSSTDLINYGNVGIYGWIVASDGTVVVNGQTYSTNQYWTRAISPSGSIQGLPAAGAPLPAQFPDGNVYLYWYDSSAGEYGVRRYLVDQRQIEPGFWMADTRRVSGQVTWDTSALCGDSYSNDITCGYSSASKIVTTRSDEVWGISGDKVVRLFPSPAVADLGLKPGVMTAAGNRIAVSGTDAAGNQITKLHNPTNGVQKTLLGADNQVEVFSLNYTASSGLIMFDGVRYSDGKYVVGTIDPGSGAVSMDVAGKMSQVVTFEE